MKKLVFAFAAFVAMSFAACGGQTNSAKAANDSDTVAVVDSNIVDSIVEAVDTVVAE